MKPRTKNRLVAFTFCLGVFVLITLIARGFDYFNTLDEERIRWLLAIVLVAGLIALLPKKKRN